MKSIILKISLLASILIFAQGLLTRALAQKEVSLLETEKGELLLKQQFSISNNGTMAIAADNRNIFVARFNDPNFTKYNLWGNVSGPDFQVEGITNGLTSLTYDGSHFWGTDKSSTIYKLALQVSTPAIAGTLTLPYNVTFCTFDQSADEENGGFWAGCENDDIVLISKTGTELSRISAATHGLVSITGATMDNINLGGPYLWVMSSIGNKQAVITRIQLPNGESTKIWYDLHSEGFTDENDKGGGMFTLQLTSPKRTYLTALIQNRKVLCFDLETLKYNTYDIGITSLSMSDYVLIGENYSVTGKIKNFASKTVNSYKLHYKIDNGEIITYNFSGINIAPLEEISFVHPESVETVPGNHIIKVWTSLPNGETDEVLDNDEITFSYIVYNPAEVKPRVILIEKYTSSTCQPCLLGSQLLYEALEKFDGPYALINLQMNWPGLGDPYYTEEGNVRRTVYNVTGIPDLYIDGKAKHFDNINFEAAQNTPAVMDLKVDYFVDGKTVYAKAEINSSINYLDDNMRLYLAIVEKTTTENVLTNGETEFKQVMKKFMPNAEGIFFERLEANVPYVTNQKWEFKGEYRLPDYGGPRINHEIEHSVEEFDDLTIVAWIQNPEQKIVRQACNGNNTEKPIAIFKSLNSEYGAILATVNGNTLLSGETFNNGETIIFTAQPIEGYEVKEWTINGEVLSNTFSNSIDIKAEGYIDVTVDFQVKSRICNKLLSDVRIYPNPFTNILTITNSENIRKITIVNVIGQTVKELNYTKTNSIIINTAEMLAGIYFVTLQTTDGVNSVYRIIKQ